MTRTSDRQIHSTQILRQKQFIRNENRKIRLLYLLRVFLFLFFLALWEFTASRGILNPFIFSSPSRVCETIGQWHSQNVLAVHIGSTMQETVISFLIVTVLGIASAIFLWRFPFIYRVLEPYFILFNSLPKSALAPLLIVWLGNQPRTIILVAVSLAIFSSILTLYNAFLQIDPDKIKLIRSLNGTRIHIVQKVLLPACIPVFISNMKVNIGLCLVGVIIGEFLAAREGLGYLIIYGSQVFKMDWVVAAILILCVIAIFLYAIITLTEKLYTGYYLKNK
ncbi:MAG: ABC transporter permease [Lachnospiraceae bacterium]|nr:ABC transporter permease [Lachnospiraceae bacterium]